MPTSTNKTLNPITGGLTYAFAIPTPASGNGTDALFSAANGGKVEQSTGSFPQDNPPGMKQCCMYAASQTPPAGGFEARALFLPNNLPGPNDPTGPDGTYTWTGFFPGWTGPANDGNQWFAAIAAADDAPAVIVSVNA